MSCDGQDIILKNALLPTNLNVGDWICFGGLGAYSKSMQTNFNGMSC